MNIVDFSLRRRVTVAMVGIAVLLFGGVAFQRLPVNLLPEITYPSLTLETRYPGAAPAEVEALLTRPIEEAVGVVTGVERITSVSRPGLSQVTLEFGWDREMDFAALDVRQKLDLVTLPREAEKPVLLRFDPSNDPILRLYVTSVATEAGGAAERAADGAPESAPDLFRLRYLGEEVLKKDLESVEGLAAVKVHGGFEEEIQVRVDEGKLSLLGLSIEDVRDRLARENINQAGGSLYEREARYLVRSRNEFEDLDDILGIILQSEGGRQVTLADVATVQRGGKQREVITRFNDREAVELALYKEGDANTVAVARAVNARLESLKKELPPGIAVTAGADQSRFIQASIREVLSNALLGGAIAIVVLLLFLRDLRSTVIIGVSIPLSIVATFFLMYQTGTTLNIMSLGGLALGVGMLVDNAIVVLEAIHKRRERGEGALAAARQGASEVGRAVIASTLTTVAVFLPVVFLEGVAAQLFLDQALTVSFALIASLAVALTLIPMMAGLMGGGAGPHLPGPPLPAHAPALAGEGGESLTLRARLGRGVRSVLRFVLVTVPSWLLTGIRWLTRWTVRILSWVFWPVARVFDAGLAAVAAVYPRLLGWSLAHRGLVVLVALLALGGTVALVPSLGVDLIPPLSQGELGFRVELPEGTPLDVTDRFLAGVQEGLADDPRVESVAVLTGGAGLSLTRTGTEGENVGRIQVRMAPGSDGADEEAVAAELRRRLDEVPEARAEIERPQVLTFRTPVEVEIYGDRLPELHAAASQLRDRLDEVPGVVDLESSAELGNPEIQVTFQRERLTLMGLDLAQVAATVRNKVQGEVATHLSEGDREIEIRVRSVEHGEASVEDVGELIVGQRTVNGRDVPIRLKSVADLRVAEGPSEIRRIGQKRAAVLAGNLQGRDMGSVAADLRAALAEEALPAGVVATLGGQQEEMSNALRSLLFALALAAFLVYLVMASQFESFLHPFVILFTLPLGAIGVIGALALTGHTVNVVAMIGAVMLAGIVVNNAIVLVDAVNRLRREEGLPKHEALLRAGQDRLRPILMTSATTIFGLLPMALGLGEGAELRAPLAVTVIGGLAVGTVLTLVVIPVVYSLLDRQTLPVDATEGARKQEASSLDSPLDPSGEAAQPALGGGFS